MAVPIATAQLATANETVIATLPPSNWSAQAIGNLLSGFITATASGAATLTLRIRQGTTTAGAQVGTNMVTVFAGAANNVPAGGQFVDASAFALGAQAAAQYVLTAQATVASTITPAGGVLELETIAPVT